MAQEVTEKTRRQQLLDRLKGRNPDLDIDDDEAVSGQIASDYDMMDQRDDERKRFNDMLSQNPYAAPISKRRSSGTSFSRLRYTSRSSACPSSTQSRTTMPLSLTS